ncbi:MAG: EAL domain-containing protein [Gammaproteobacteria bacterium]|nr:EAL domain-containing protein [Gammaproteobacteria bacterium]
MALDLINTCVLLLALSLLQGFIARVFRNDAALQQLVSGLLFTGACLFAMTIQIHLVNGSTIDARALILSLGGLFGGPIVAVISASLVTAYLVGMSAVSYTDIAILLASTLLGLTFRQAVSRDWIKPGFFQLMALGFVVHACAGLLLNLVAVDPRPGQWAYLSLPMVFIFSLATAMLGLLLVDIEKRAKSESALIESQALMSHHLENTPLAAITWDKDFRCTQWNKAAEKIFGYSAAEALGRHGADLLIPQHLKQDILNQYQELINNRTGSQKVNENMTRDGKIIVCEWYNTPVFDEHGETIGIASLGEDITSKKKAEELIWQQANYDGLTGLANRKLLQDRLEQEIRKAKRAGQSVALLYLDLDQFKDINDTLGHQIGDSLLREAAHRLTGFIREADTVARLGGDEFTIVMGGLDEVNSVERVASGILDQMSQPFQLAQETAYISASIGITFYPQDGTQIDELLKNADQAMYAAKNMGRNCFQYFTPSMQQSALRRMSTVKDLHAAVANNEFELHYQPIVDLTSGIICKGEALLRWQHPEHGLMMPDSFICYAEETRLINPIGDWVYQQALRQVNRWRRTYDPDFQICINASPVQFDLTSPSIDHWIDGLRQQNLPGKAVAIEITEGLLMENVGKFTRNLLKLRDAGIQVSLDDFGTGYSSLAYLKRLDIDYLKIDRSFVKNLGMDSDDMVLCHAIIAMAHKLGLRVVAEGIETRQQRALLESAGCDYGQGYYFSKPVTAASFEVLLAEVGIAS